jgi:hypothetical protein
MNQTVVFQAFGPNHGATVIVVALVRVLLPRGMRARGSPTLRLPVGEGLGLALLGHEALKIAELVLGYGLPPLQSLPLHLCGVSVFLPRETPRLCGGDTYFTSGLLRPSDDLDEHR